MKDKDSGGRVMKDVVTVNSQWYWLIWCTTNGNVCFIDSKHYFFTFPDPHKRWSGHLWILNSFNLYKEQCPWVAPWAWENPKGFQEGHQISKPFAKPNMLVRLLGWPQRTMAEEYLPNLHQRKQSCLGGTRREAKNSLHEIKVAGW